MRHVPHKVALKTAAKSCLKMFSLIRNIQPSTPSTKQVWWGDWVLVELIKNSLWKNLPTTSQHEDLLDPGLPCRRDRRLSQSWWSGLRGPGGLRLCLLWLWGLWRRWLPYTSSKDRYDKLFFSLVSIPISLSQGDYSASVHTSVKNKRRDSLDGFLTSLAKRFVFQGYCINQPNIWISLHMGTSVYAYIF